MTFRLLSLVAATVLVTACADESAKTTDERVAPDVQTAYLGLTVIDCQSEATQCVRAGQRRFLSATVGCSLKLNACLVDVAAQAAVQVVGSAEEVLSCGQPSVDCVASAKRLRDVVACEAAVETCVVDKVDELTGIQLPTTHEVVEVVAGAAEDIVTTGVVVIDGVAQTGVHVVGEVVETGVEVVGAVAEGSVEVVGAVAEGGVQVVGAVVDTTVGLAGDTIGTAVTVVDTTVQTAGAVVHGALDGVDNVLDCSAEARSCWRTTRDLFACQKSYGDCLATR
jgi:hypothetical protein